MGYFLLLLLASFLLGLGILISIIAVIRKAKKGVYIGLGLSLFSIVLGSAMAVLATTKVAEGMFALFHSETDDSEVYAEILGRPDGCVELINFKPAFPIIDDVVCFEVKCCPEEIARLTSGYTVDSNKQTPNYGGGRPKWFKTEDMLHLYLSDSSSNIKRDLYINTDSTRAFIADIGH
ncbi:MAG: hypothetical protein HWD92_02755 [Flavobacteriia bacterium]|nr:hypothetical protein [Flavobacteriia bacterium]